MKDVAALSRIKRLLSPRRNELAAGADDAHGESRQQLAVRWSSNSSGLFPPPTTPPLSDPTTNHPCWKVFGRRWRRGLAKSYRVICLLRRRTTSGRRGERGWRDEGSWTLTKMVANRERIGAKYVQRLINLLRSLNEKLMKFYSFQ